MERDIDVTAKIVDLTATCADNSVDSTADISNNDVDLETATVTREIDVSASIYAGSVHVYEKVGTDDRMPEYHGPYEVIPKSYSQTLETRRQAMLDDVLIHEIPTFEVSNEQGYSFIIGDE